MLNELQHELLVVGRRAISIENLRYHVLPGKFGGVINPSLFKDMFVFWKRQWEPLVKGLVGAQTLSSDDFLRQFEVNAISYEGEIVGLLCLDLFDLNSQVHLAHSYFSWLKADDWKIFEKLGHSLIINQLAVAKLWRGEFGIGDLLVGLAVKRMSVSPFDHTICYTRNFRRTNSLAERWGANLLLDNQVVHNEPSSYYDFSKNCFAETNHQLKSIVERLWQNGIDKETIILNEINLNHSTKKGRPHENEINQ